MQAPILVPVDFSTCASDALGLAADIARGQGAPIVVLHVVPGSVAEAVVRHSDVPVTVVKETRQDDLHETAA